ncbi:LPS export ABC transporter permease LptG [Phaeovulum sp.]|uniref:LPS export ABC transporter permease LptG n=1 Tax=Phaeovulum sp. TaxID=2934796 RepID=UPI003568EE9A
MTLTLYFARRFIRDFLLVAAAFCAVMLLIDSVEQLRRFGGSGIGLERILFMASLNLPGAIYTLLPLLILLATMSMFIGLARSSELVVARAAGRSALRMALVPATVAFLVGAIAVVALNPVVAATAKRYDALTDRILSGGTAAASIGSEGVWLRQGVTGAKMGQRQSVIHASSSNADATVLYDVTVMEFSLEQGPIRYLKASEAALETGAWRLREVKEWPLAETENPEAEAVIHADLTLPSDLTPARIRDSFGTPSEIAIWDLPDFIAALERAGFSSRRHVTWFQKELAQPLMLAAMALLAAAFSMRHVRRGRVGLMALLAFGTGVAALLLRNFSQALGENGLLPVLLAAWAPPLVALLVALTLLLYLEDG